MKTNFVRVLCDVHCDWEGLPPTYRVHVNGELFAERTWDYGNDIFLEEMLQIQAPPGHYDINFELVKPHLATLQVKNIRVDYGPGTAHKNQVRIYDEIS